MGTSGIKFFYCWTGMLKNRNALVCLTSGEFSACTYILKRNKKLSIMLFLSSFGSKHVNIIKHVNMIIVIWWSHACFNAACNNLQRNLVVIKTHTHTDSARLRFSCTKRDKKQSHTVLVQQIKCQWMHTTLPPCAEIWHAHQKNQVVGSISILVLCWSEHQFMHQVLNCLL